MFLLLLLLFLLLIIGFRYKSLPQADHLRYLTAKLGQYLGIKQNIPSVPLQELTTRFIIDLNLPCRFAFLFISLKKKTPTVFLLS